MAVAYYTNAGGVKVPLPVPIHNHDANYSPANHIHGVFDTGWVPLSFQNDWYNYGTGWEPGEYRRLNGVVHLKGLMGRVASTPPDTGDVLATLPLGCRPLERLIFLGNSPFTSPGGSRIHGQRVDIHSDGSINPQYINDRDGNTWVSISSITFIAEA